MALRISTGVRNAVLSQQATVTAMKLGADCAYVDGGASADTITNSANDFVSAGFVPGGYVRTYNSTTAANDGIYLVTDVAAGTLTLETGDITTAEAFAATTFVVQAFGGSIKDLFRNCIIRVFSGTQPTTADSAETGTILLEITKSGETFSAGSFTNGLMWGDATSGVLAKATSETWQGTGLTSGAMGWFRMYANDVTTGASTSAMRIDGSIATSGGQITVATTAITLAAQSTLDTLTLTFPTN